MVAHSGPLGDSESYELLKNAWISQHPDATPAEYELAMRLIAEQLRY